MPIIRRLLSQLRRLPDTLDDLKLALGRIEARQLGQINGIDLSLNEFRVFSQWGEDGILQYLIRKVGVAKRVFVEFGVSNYDESNTRFLLQNDNWSGLVIDGSRDNIEFIRRQPYYWRYNLKAECAFIERDNINALLDANGIEGDIGLLSIDIDGNDYWVWQAIDGVRPAIVVCEYNSLFGCERHLSIPYSARFSRSAAHHSCLYFGASLPALVALGKTKGYALVGSNSAGNNAFFVRRELLGSIPEKTPSEVYIKAQFRESRDSAGQLSFLDFDSGRKLIENLPLHDFESGRIVTLKEVTARD